MNTELIHIEAELKKLHGTRWRKVESGQIKNYTFEYTVVGHEYTWKNYNGTSYPHKIYMICKTLDDRDVNYLYEDLLQLEQIMHEEY